MILFYRYRVKSNLGALNKQARAVNFVWNFCNDTQKHALKWDKKWPSGYDLQKLCAGSSKELGILYDIIANVCAQYERSRRGARKAYLRYRGRRSLGWIPLRAPSLRQTKAGFHVQGREFRIFKSREIPNGAKIKDGCSFARDARGNWFINVCVELPEPAAKPITSAVGIDLGLKNFATLSNGESVAAPRLFRQMEASIGMAQRAGKKRLVASRRAKVTNSRQDFLHKLSTQLARGFDYIAVGNVNAAKLAKTKMAKSVNDASWSSFRSMLAYKSIANGAKYEEVDEKLTSQTCSCCGALPIGRPIGIAGLGIREWDCSECGAVLDRDVNAARNILARGLSGLAEGGAHAQ